MKNTNMATYTEEEIHNHEQSLLWTFRHILDKIVSDKESYDIAVKEFKEQLIFKDKID